MASVKFYLRDPESANETLIYLNLAFEGKRYKFSTHESVHPRFWNKEEHKVRKSFPGHAEINDRLQKTAEDYSRALRILINLNARITSKKLHEKVEEMNQVVNKENKSFLGYVSDFITASELRVKHGTIKSYKTTQSVLIRFQQNLNRRLEFNSIDLNFYDDFNIFLQKKLGYSKNTAGKHIKNIKVFMREATERGLNNNMDFLKKGFKVGREDIDSIYLSEEELEYLYNLDFEGDERMEHVRDLFIVGCYTGLRFSDFSQIKKENIRNGLISIRTEKTEELISIPVHPLIEKIISKYKGRYSNGLPPAYANQVMNNYLKRIGEKAEFFEGVIVKKTVGGKKVEEKYKKYELISTHTARRSFATNLFLQDFPAISIMKITGHRSEKNFLNYIKMSPHQNAEKLRKHWQSFYKGKFN